MAGRKEFKILDIKTPEADARIFMIFIQTADAVQKYADAVLYRAGLSVTKLMVLQVLELNGGTMTPSEIARWTAREKHNITTLVRRLQKGGLVSVKRDSDDKRYVRITLTDKGRATIKKTLPAAMSIVKKVMPPLSDSQADMLESSLKTLRENAYNELNALDS